MSKPTDAETEAKLDRLMAEVARNLLAVPTLETRGSDAQDFHDLSVWRIKAALRRAFDLGVDQGASTGGRDIPDFET